jgi:RNase H-fold protein (predicted Holliday junction resolvase)
MTEPGASPVAGAPAPADIVIAIDPGTGKCGLAAVRSDGAALRQEVVSAVLASGIAAQWAGEFGASVIVLGDGTGCRCMQRSLERLTSSKAVSLMVVNERCSSEEARRLYLQAHPPRGLARLVPPFMRYPDGCYDDYCAVVLARRWFALNPGSGVAPDPEKP